VILTEAKALNPHVWLNVHSGMYALFTPYDHKAQVGAVSSWLVQWLGWVRVGCSEQLVGCWLVQWLGWVRVECSEQLVGCWLGGWGGVECEGGLSVRVG